MRASLKWTCIGFDLRAPGINMDDATLKTQLLVARKPILSGDPLVWKASEAMETFRRSSNNNSLFNPFGLANDPDVLTRLFRKEARGQEPGMLVAFSVDSMVLEVLSQGWGPGYFDAPQLKIDFTRGWNSVGFDVLDLPGLTSGLCGCGYDPIQRHLFLPYFANQINRFGLLDSFDAATRFASLRSLQVREHAPFIPVQLFTRPTGS